MSTSSRLYLDVQPAVHGALGPFFVDSTDRRPDEKDDQAGQAEPRRDNKEELQALVPVETTLTTGMAGRAEDLLALIGRRKENIVDAFYDIREALKEILDRKLYLALKQPSFDELIAARSVVGRTQAYKLIAVARELPRDGNQEGTRESLCARGPRRRDSRCGQRVVARCEGREGPRKSQRRLKHVAS
jgi:hypothetical protein